MRYRVGSVGHTKQSVVSTTSTPPSGESGGGEGGGAGGGGFGGRAQGVQVAFAPASSAVMLTQGLKKRRETAGAADSGQPATAKASCVAGARHAANAADAHTPFTSTARSPVASGAPSASRQPYGHQPAAPNGGHVGGSEPQGQSPAVALHGTSLPTSAEAATARAADALRSAKRSSCASAMADAACARAVQRREGGARDCHDGAEAIYSLNSGECVTFSQTAESSSSCRLLKARATASERRLVVAFVPLSEPAPRLPEAVCRSGSMSHGEVSVPPRLAAVAGPSTGATGWSSAAHGSSMTHEEVEFCAEEALVTIVPAFRKDAPLALLGGRYGPFIPQARARRLSPARRLVAPAPPAGRLIRTPRRGARTPATLQRADCFCRGAEARRAHALAPPRFVDAP